MSEIDQQFVEYVVKSLVSKPDAVHIDRRIDEKGVLLELTVDPEDLGRVIGKRGATAQSLRTLLRALGTKNDARYNLKIVDNGTGATATPAAASDDVSEGVEAPASSESPAVSAPAASADSEDEEDTKPPEDETSDRLRKARQELADLDDLDV